MALSRSQSAEVAAGDTTSPLLGVRVPPEEARALLTSQPNLMLVGHDAITSQVLQSLRPLLRQPVWQTGAAPLTLPQTSSGALVVQHATNLASEDQVRLLEWIQEHRPQVQLVTVAEMPLFPLVRRGAFLETLYYLLNTMYLEL